MLEAINEFFGLVTLTLVPYALCSLGIMITGRTGIFNIAGEGVMLVGASSGFVFAYLTNNLAIGLLSSLLLGGLYVLLLAFFSETMKINQFTIGICLFILGLGTSDFLFKAVMGLQLVAPTVPILVEIPIPVLNMIPVIGALFNQNILVYFTYIMTAILYYLLFKTRIGLNLRAVGENPKAADVVGINVVRTRYIATIIGGMLMGLAGAYFPLEITGTYMPLIAGGRGFIAIGLTIFASWRPERILIGSFLFAGIEVLSYKLQIINIGLPYQFLLMLPFIFVLIMVWVFYKRSEFPSALGSPYSRE